MTKIVQAQIVQGHINRVQMNVVASIAKIKQSNILEANDFVARNVWAFDKFGVDLEALFQDDRPSFFPFAPRSEIRDDGEGVGDGSGGQLG